MKALKLVFKFLCTGLLSTALLASNPTEPGPLVIYSGRSEALVGPLFKQFTEKTGIKVDVRYNDTGPLATQALVEAQQTPADVFFFQESGYLSLLANKGLLQKLPQDLLNISSQFQDPHGFWVATSARARVLVYNTEQLKKEDLPNSLKDLAHSKWQNKLGWAPTNASLQAHISVLRHLWGEQETTDWLKAFIANKPIAYPKNAAQVLAVGKGEIAVAWTNHYYLYQLKQQQPDLPIANYSFPNKQDAGNILILSGIAIRKDSPRALQAKKLISFLLSQEAQNYFTQEAFEYPVGKDVTINPNLPSLEALNLANIDQAWVADVQPTLTLLQKLGAL